MTKPSRLSPLVLILAVVSSCSTNDSAKMVEGRSSTTKTDPHLVAIEAYPYRWNTGEVWNYRILWTDADRMKASFNGKHGGAENYANAIETGAAHRLDFGVQVKILEVIPGFKWWATKYRVHVLDGPLKGVEGWVDFEAINANANGGIQE